MMVANDAMATAFSKRALLLSAAIAAFGAGLHVVALLAGPAWIKFFRAPPAVVASAEAGTWLAPVSTLAIAFAMAICTVYALSAVGKLPRLPFLRLVMSGIALICSLRVLILIPLALWRPDLIDTFEMIAVVFWFFGGFGFVQFFLTDWRQKSQA
jgi:hypothetical protein